MPSHFLDVQIFSFPLIHQIYPKFLLKFLLNFFIFFGADFFILGGACTERVPDSPKVHYLYLP